MLRLMLALLLLVEASDISAQPLRWQGTSVVRQSTPWSCGAAALATVLSALTRHVVAEASVIAAALGESAPLERSDRSGLSLAQLRHAAAQWGFAATGVKLDMPSLQLVPLPFLVRLADAQGAHFSALLAISESADGARRYHLADPTVGDIALPEEAFARLFLNHGSEGAALVMAPSKTRASP